MGSDGRQDGTQRAIRIAGAEMLAEGHRWARRVQIAQRLLHQAVDRDYDEDTVAEARRAVLIARGDDARLRAALDELERQVEASPEPHAQWTAAARVEAQRVRAGLEGRPDPTGGAPGLRRGWRDLPRAIIVGIVLWILLAAVGTAVVVAQTL